MADPKKHTNRQEKLAPASLPQKIARSLPIGEPAKLPEECRPEDLASPELAEEIVEHEEFLLDEALELTFPASDPIAIPDAETVAKAVCRLEHAHRPLN